MTTNTYRDPYPRQSDRKSDPGRRVARIILGTIVVLLIIGAGVLLAFLVLFSPASSNTTIPTRAPLATIPPTIPIIAGLPTTKTPEPTAASTIDTTPVEPAPTATTTQPAGTTTTICQYRLQYVADITVPDDTIFTPGTPFVKTWRVRNNGTCTWESGAIWTFSSGDHLNGPDAIAIPVTAPGQTADISVNLVAPHVPGKYTGYWSLRLPDGQAAENRVFVRIVVAAPATATSTPPVIVHWRGAYYNNAALTGLPVLVRDDPAVNFNWGFGAPAAGLPHDSFSAKWTRSLYFNGGRYRFHAVMDDGMRFFINNVLVIGDWRDGSQREITVDYYVPAGNQNLRIEYYERTGRALAAFWWEQINEYPQWRGEYWSNPHLNGPSTLVRNDPNLNFNWGFESPDQRLPADHFSARWTRQLNFPGGTYTLFARADDGVRVYVDGYQIINEWHNNDANNLYQATIALNGMHTITVEYYENTLQAQVHFWYQAGVITATPTATGTATAIPPTMTPTATAPPPTPTVTAIPPTMTPTATTPPPTPTATAPPPTATPTATVPPPIYPGLFNEVLPYPQDVDWNGDGHVDLNDQWIELANFSRAPIDLSGWRIAHQNSSGTANADYQFPSHSILRPGQFLVLYAGKTGFVMNTAGSTIVLINREGVVKSQLAFPSLNPDASYSREPGGLWHDDWPPSPGTQNRPSS